MTDLTTATETELRAAAAALLARAEHAGWAGPGAARRKAETLRDRGAHSDLVLDGERLCLADPACAKGGRL